MIGVDAVGAGGCQSAAKGVVRHLEIDSPGHDRDDQGYDLEGCFPDFTYKPGTEGLAYRWGPEPQPFLF